MILIRTDRYGRERYETENGKAQVEVEYDRAQNLYRALWRVEYCTHTYGLPRWSQWHYCGWWGSAKEAMAAAKVALIANRLQGK